MAEPTTAASGSADRTSYAQILKSSALIGGASLLNVLVGIVRTKATAVLLGPAGVGAMGLYSAILEFTQSVAGLGINSSGVRQIAVAHASTDTEHIARTATVLGKTSLLLGVVGALGLAALSTRVSSWTFGTPASAGAIVVLAIAVFLRCIADGQGAAIQGMRRVADLAWRGVITAVLGAAVSLVLLLLLGERGIVPSLVATTAVALVVSWWFRRRIVLPAPTRLSLRDIAGEAGPLVRLGVAFMASAVVDTGSAYVVRALVREQSGLAAAGLYQAAWAIGGLYIGFILQAMGSDFYPRLTGVADDHAACNRLVNEQTRIGLLLAGPGVLATLALSPWIIALLYHAEFGGAVQPLRFICVGMALRVIAWPMGYVILAKGARNLFLATECAAAVVHVALAYVLVPRFGVAGATIAFAGLYVWHSAAVYLIARHLTGFAWSRENKQAIAEVLLLVSAIFALCVWAPPRLSLSVGVVATVGAGVRSLRQLSTLVPMSRAPRYVKVVMRKFGVAIA
jgi:enterobacterial common antigen flippase